MNIDKEKQLTQKIVSIGFTEYEAKVFLVLYKGYKMSAAEISKLAKIPRTSVYDILRIFVKKGLCNEIEIPTKSIYEIIDKKVLEDKVVIETETEFKEKLNKIKNCFNELSPIFRSEQLPEYKADVELIRGFNRQREHKFMELINNSKKAILLMNRFTAFASDELDDTVSKFYKRGGSFKSIYETSTDFKIKINNRWQNATKESLIKICESFIKQGEQIKLINQVPQVVAIFDEEIVYFSLFDENIPKGQNSDIIIKNKNFAGFIINLFDLYWDKAETIEQIKKHFINNNLKNKI